MADLIIHHRAGDIFGIYAYIYIDGARHVYNNMSENIILLREIK